MAMRNMSVVGVWGTFVRKGATNANAHPGEHAHDGVQVYHVPAVSRVWHLHPCYCLRNLRLKAAHEMIIIMMQSLAGTEQQREA